MGVQPLPLPPVTSVLVCLRFGTKYIRQMVFIGRRRIFSAGLHHAPLVTVPTAGAIAAGINLTNADIHLSYLPLAHVFERLVEAVCWNAGASVGFYQVRCWVCLHWVAPTAASCFSPCALS